LVSFTRFKRFRRRLGIHPVLRCTYFRTSWGFAVLAASEKGLCGLCLPTGSIRQARELARRRWPDAAPTPNLLPKLQEQVRTYFLGQPVRFRVPLDLTGLTDFQQAVLRACRAIDYGTTTTYGALAAAVGRPGAARAVGAVMARNPIPLIIPCHRVLGADGRLGGFSAEGGVDVKRRMLRLEGLYLELKP